MFNNYLTHFNTKKNNLFKKTNICRNLNNISKNSYYSFKAKNYQSNLYLNTAQFNQSFNFFFILKKLFNFLFFFNYYNQTNLHKLHFNYRLLFANIVNNNVTLNNTKVVQCWTHCFFFLFNIFYYNLNPTLFSTLVFKNETLAINWLNYEHKLSLWNYSSSFFYFKTNKFNIKIEFFFKKLAFLNLNFIFISDCSYHYKNLYYLNKNNLCTLGLVDCTINPWLITYPLPCLTNSLIIQLFFIKFLLFSYKHVLQIKYEYYKNIWQIIK